ncbi:MAG: EAL domain-containing protein [Zoogloeaceae bacterium]|jgi:diguanylate cyclase (GGDEF)-like protein/PAS domain S-box-containing protein|nr:EAL domain-containing protein [Zoogloeaceae bacterium]
MVFKKRFHSLRIRLTLVSVLISMLIVLMVMGNSAHLVTQYLQKQSELRLAETEKIYSAALIPLLASHDYAALLDLLTEWKQSSDDILYLALEGEDRRLASVNWPEDQPLPKEGLSGDKKQRSETIPLVLGGHEYGRLYLGYDMVALEQLMDAMLLQGFLFAAVGLALLSFLLSFLLFYLTRGLSYLSEASLKVSQGNFRMRLPEQGNDEIAQLSSGFNLMVNAVQSRIGALEESERRFRAIADYTYAWESWHGVDGNLKWVSPAVQRIIGYSPEECMTMPDYPLPLVHPDDREMIQHMIQQATGGHSGQDLEFRAQCRNGRTIWAMVSWQPIQDEHGNDMGYRTSVHDVTLQHHTSEELAYQAVHDPLTGLNNRRSFERQLQQALAASKHDNKPVVLLYVDLDQFKVINDTCGHVAGDQLLVDLSKTLAEKLSGDFLARLGGDEFGILMRDCDEKEAVRRAERLIEAIRGYSFVYSGRAFRLGASAGVVRATPDMDNFTSLLMAADTACYAAKERGRNRVELYAENDEYFQVRNEEFRSVGHITSALSEGRFILYFQRVEALRPDLPTHAEVLLRLRDFLGNVQSPARFIAAAERFNLMPYIDRWVVENVCRQLSEWKKAGIKTGVSHFAVNVSGSSLSDRDFPDFVQQQIQEFDVDADRLCFEITESCAVGQITLALEFIDRMRSLGASLSLDDFGSGLSSFAYLKQFKVDHLKIDGMFVKNIDHDASDSAVVRAMVQLAGAHGLKTIAEFVSSEPIYETVKSLGVDYAQGYARHIPEPFANLGKKNAAKAA